MKILIAVDLSDSTQKVIEETLRIVDKKGTKLWLLHIAEPDPDFVGWEPGPQSERDFIASKFHNEHTRIQSLAKSLRNKGYDATALLVQGAIAETILKEAKNLKVDFIAVGSHGRGMMYQLLMGCVSEGILQNTERPVLVVPTREL